MHAYEIASRKKKQLTGEIFLKVLYGKIYDIQLAMYMKIVQLLIILLIEFNVVGLLIRNIIITEKNPTGICQSSAVKPQTRYDYILACKDRLNYAIYKNICIAQARSILIKSILSYLTSYYGNDLAMDEYYKKATNLLREQRKLLYDSSLLNTKYKLYLLCFDRIDFVHKFGAKISLWSKKVRDAK